MKPLNQLNKTNPEEFKRLTGISKKNFELLSNKVSKYILRQQQLNPLSKRGLKSRKLTIDDCILLTLYYLRHYPTFINLAHVFEISESYCHKIYTRYARILAQVETLPNRKELIETPPKTLIVDVSEQPIERPVKNQKKYYSGKKKTYN